MTVYAFVDESGVERLRGSIVPAPTSATPMLADVLAAGGDPDGNPVTGNMQITPDTSVDGLTITSPSNNNTKLIDATAGHQTFSVNCDGVARIESDDNMALHVTGTDDSGASILLENDPTGYAVIGRVSSSSSSILATDQNGNAIGGFDSDIGIVLAVHTAPADGGILAGQLMFWFDQTNGAAKLMLKGKSANGTVVTGFVALV